MQDDFSFFPLPLISTHSHSLQLVLLMGKTKKKGKTDESKAAAKAAKRAKQEKVRKVDSQQLLLLACTSSYLNLASLLPFCLYVGQLADKKATKSQKKDQALLQAATAKTSTGGGKSGKGGKKNGKKPAQEEEEDLDALLASIRAQWEQEHTVHEEKVGGPPSRRANAT